MNRNWYLQMSDYIPLIKQIEIDRVRRKTLMNKCGPRTPGCITDDNTRTNFNKWCNLPDSAKRLYWKVNEINSC